MGVGRPDGRGEAGTGVQRPGQVWEAQTGMGSCPQSKGWLVGSQVT